MANTPDILGGESSRLDLNTSQPWNFNFTPNDDDVETEKSAQRVREASSFRTYRGVCR